MLSAPGHVSTLSANLPRNINKLAAIGTVPYVAAICSEFTVVRLSSGTMLGTTESLAGIQRRVKISNANDASTRCQTVVANGSKSRIATRPRSHKIMTFFLFHLSTKTPASGARNKPGMILAVKTNPTAVSGVPPPNSVAAAAMARNPNQSPNDPTN